MYQEIMSLRSSGQQKVIYTDLENVLLLENSFFTSHLNGVEAVVPSEYSMSSDESCSDLNTPYLSVIVQPNSTHRFRYKSEKGSHGCITGVSQQRTTKTYPTVKLINFQSNEAVVVKASLYTDEDVPQPHVLELVGKTCGNGVCLEKLDANCIAKFSNMRVENKKKEEVIKFLIERRVTELKSERKPVDRKKIEKEAQEHHKMFNLNSVKICFEAFYTIDMTTPLCERVFCHTISNHKTAISGDLRITRLSSCTGKCSGGEDIILLCEKVKKEDIKIRFFEKEGNWSAFATFTPADVHHQYAITFKTPQFIRNDEECVFIELYRPSDEKCGVAVEFHYIPDEHVIPGKRRRVDSEHSSVGFQSSSSQSCASQTTNLIPEMEDVENINLRGDISFGNSFATSEQYETLSSPPIEDETSEILPMDNESFQQILRELEMPDELFSDLPRLVSIFGDPVGDLSCDGVEEERVTYSLTSCYRDGPINHFFDLLRLGPRANLRHFVAIVRWMSSTAGINIRNSSKETPLHLAIRTDNIQALIALLICGGNPNILNQDGDTCLHLASKINLIRCMKILLSPLPGRKQISEILDIDALNYDGLAPLHLSILNNLRNGVKLLLHCKADVNVVEKKSGRTALHLAIETQTSLVNTLLAWPEIDMDIEDFRGYTPLQSACDMKGMLYEDVSAKIGSDDQQIIQFLKNLYCDDEKNEQSNEIMNDQPDTHLDSGEIEQGLCSDTIVEKMNVLSKDTGQLHSTYINENADSYFQVEKKLCEFLDASSGWRKLGECIGIEEKELNFVEKLSEGSSPTRTMIRKFKELYPEDTRLMLIELLQSLHLNQAANILKNYRS